MKRILIVVVALVVIAGIVLGAQAYVSQSYTIDMKVPIQMTKTTRNVYPREYAYVSIHKMNLIEYISQGRSVPYRLEAGYMDVNATMTIGDDLYQTMAHYEWPKEAGWEGPIGEPLNLKFTNIDTLGNATVIVTYDIHNQLISSYDSSVIWWENETMVLFYSFDATAIYESGHSLKIIATFYET